MGLARSGLAPFGFALRDEVFVALRDEVFVGVVAPDGHFEVEGFAGSGGLSDGSEGVEEPGDEFVEINGWSWS